MDIEQNAVLPVEDAGVEPPSSETPPVAQAPVEPQTTDTVVVDNGSKEPQVTEASRRKPSDYYRERQTIRELKETVASLQKRMEERAALKEEKKPDVPEVPDFDPAHFSPEHKRILLAREKALREQYDARISAFEQKFNTLEQSKAAMEAEQKSQEALEKLFPKSSPDSTETLEKRVQRDPERAQRIRDYLIESGLNEFSKINPAMAAEIALEKMGEGPRKANPTILKKGLMGGASTGNPGMGEKRSVSEQDLRAENKKMADQLSSNPSLRYDAKFMERRAQVLQNLEGLVKEKR